MILELAFLLPVYAIMGGIMGGFTRHMMRFHKDDDRAAGTFFAALFWPVAVLVWVCLVTVLTTVKQGDRISRKAAERYRGKVARAKTEMMESDAQRLGGHMELALQFDYETCPRCYGAGGGGGRTCPECKGKGAVRLKNGIKEAIE